MATTVINRAMFPLSSGISNIMGMKERYDTLQTQLSSGLKATRLSEMGSDRYFDLALRQRISRIDSFGDSIKSVNLRLNVLDQTVSRLDIVESDMRAVTLSGSGGQSSLNFDTAPALAAARLDEVMTLLNVDVAGRYLFGGDKTENRPVEDGLTILNGDGNRMGFINYVAERKSADVGNGNMGRLAITQPTTSSVQLTEDGGVVHEYGMKVSAITVNSPSAAIAVTGPTGTPPNISTAFSAVPGAGESVTVTLKMPDETTESFTLTATTDPNSKTSFQIGVDADTTAANFAAALGLAVTDKAQGTLVTASAYRAADDFFFGSGEVPKRVDLTPPATATTATGVVNGTTTNTVFWYKGGDSADPRRSVTAKVGEGATVAYGVEGTEKGMVNLVRALATMAIQNFPKSDPFATDRYNAMTSRNNQRLSEDVASTKGSIEMIAVELGLAKATTGAVAERHTAHKAQLSNMLQDIEEAPTEVVAMEILALKTRLEASYQTTAMLGQLSLVNYLK
jgi:flagellar hook-associated protein 3 FlgL